MIHLCLNSFKKGIAKYGYNAVELCLNLYYFFKRSSCQQQDLFEIEESLGLEELILLCHVQNCWLSLIPASEQLVKIKEAANKLLLVELPKDANVSISDKYMAIKKALASKEVDTEIAFLISIKPVFDEFMTKFQREEPMIHLLHPNCEKLLKSTMARPMKSKVYIEKKARALEEVDVEEMNLQLNSYIFKAMQGKKHFFVICSLVL